MSAERFREELSKPVVAPKFFSELLSKHPEILQASLVSYFPSPHGGPAHDVYREYRPVSDVKYGLVYGNLATFPHEAREIISIGATVDVCNDDKCDHSEQIHGEKELHLWWKWHDGESTPVGSQKSFIFIDVESHAKEALGAAEEVLMKENCDWYILDSGAGFHIVLDKLVDLGDLAKEHGKIILNFGRHLNKDSLKGWGNDLVDNAKNEKKLKAWCEDALRYCGHMDEPILEQGKEVHILDLRYVAHRLQSVMKYQHELNRYGDMLNKNIFSPIQEIGGFYLRTSVKRQNTLPPFVVTQKVGQNISRFNNSAAEKTQNQQSMLTL